MASAGLIHLPSRALIQLCQAGNSPPLVARQERSSGCSSLGNFNGLRQAVDVGSPRSCRRPVSPKSYPVTARTIHASSTTGHEGEKEHEEEPQGCGRREFLSSSASALTAAATLMGSSLGPGAGKARAEDLLEDWERIPLPIDSRVVLSDLAFVPDEPDHGFLLGTRQTLLETKDGGRSWIPRSIPAGEDDFNFRLISVSFQGKEGWIVGKPAILLHTTDAGVKWARVPLSARLPGNPVIIKATGAGSAEMVTDEGAIYVTGNGGYNWKAAVAETVSATLNRTVSSGISGASYYDGSFNAVNRSTDGDYVAVSSRGNFYLTWEPGQPSWQPHNRMSARRIQSMGWRADGGLWLVVRGGGLYFSKGKGITEDFEEAKITTRGFGILDVGYRTQTEAWAVGGSGTLLRTSDGGKSWVRDKAADNIGANLYTVKFFDPKKGFIIGNDAVLLRYLG